MGNMLVSEVYLIHLVKYHPKTGSPEENQQFPTRNATYSSQQEARLATAAGRSLLPVKGNLHCSRAFEMLKHSKGIYGEESWQ